MTTHLLNTKISAIPVGLVDQLRADRVALTQIPFLSVRYGVPPCLLEVFSQPSVSFICRSQNTFRALEQALPAALRESVRHYFYCTGEKTTRLAKALFAQSKVVFCGHYAHELATQLPPFRKGVHVLRGNLSSEVIEVALRQQNIAFQDHIVYQVEHTPVALTGAYAAVLFHSGSAVESFLRVNADVPVGAFFCIGESCARTLRRHTPAAPIFVAPKPTEELLFEQARAYLSGGSCVYASQFRSFYCSEKEK